ncbi:TetR/AcrR family transcriptional regulator [Nocardia cyriacigeorgica]|uniref:TetR/AcrR family transcriptional regulator n=1 Tax=Nocardia cyriacigeorgica TaxID=135487 RepID=UPI0018944CB4|nr:TetR/AcrR family transcriptional regulator [Nocardia cyriacigeorgica]MBF6084965.1 TetR/AcrR family transcriptional regulator [Nocardia cyriacigeorgica]
MGNKEDLLAAARACVYERGFAATTARDIANAAGVSLAAIGYHFGSKERLLTEALTAESGREIGDALDERIKAASQDGRSPAQAFPLVWNDIAEVFARNRQMLVASVENIIRIHRTPSETAHMSGLLAEAVAEMAELVAQSHPELSEEQARAVARLYFALLNGLALQWITEPEGELPSGDELAVAIAALAPRS